MPLFQLLIPEVQETLVRRYERRLFEQGQAAGFLAKAAAEKGADTPVPTYSLTGKLYLSQSGALLLDIPNSLVRGLFGALDVVGAELPLRDGELRAHCTVMTADEVRRIGQEKITERGKRFPYQLGAVHAVKPAGWEGVSRVWFCRLTAPALKSLRKSYGLTPLPHNNEHDFHVTFGIRRVGALGPGPVSKAATGRSRPGPDAGIHHLEGDEDTVLQLQ